MSRIWSAILISGAGTYAMRASFLAFAHRMATVPPALARALRQIPPAALAAIILPALVRPGATWMCCNPDSWPACWPAWWRGARGTSASR